MKISELISKSEVVASTVSAQLETTGVQCDSRRIRAGELFVAIHGTQEDGLRYVPAALSKGAVAIVSDAPPPAGAAHHWLQVRDVRKMLAHLAAALHGHPSHSLNIHAITGTNGKTTTCWLTREILGGNPLLR